MCCLYDLDIKKRILWTYDDGRIIQISHKCNGDKEIYLLPSAHINLDLMDAYTAQTISNELLNKLHLKLDGPETYLYVLRRGEVFIDWPIDDDFSSIAFDNPLLAALQKDILETDQLRVFVPRYLRVVPSWSY